MKEITLKNGFKFKIDTEILDNMELVDALSEMTSEEDALAISKVASLIFGKNKKAIYESFRNSKGLVPVTDIADAIKDTFEQMGDKGKK